MSRPRPLDDEAEDERDEREPRSNRGVLIPLAIVAACVAVAAGIVLVSLSIRNNRNHADSSTSERASQDSDAVTMAELFDAYKADAAAATRKYGERPLIRFRADEVDKSIVGFAAIERENGHRHRFIFNESAAKWLSVGHTYEKRGRVRYTLPDGLQVYE